MLIPIWNLCNMRFHAKVHDHTPLSTVLRNTFWGRNWASVSRVSHVLYGGEVVKGTAIGIGMRYMCYRWIGARPLIIGVNCVRHLVVIHFMAQVQNKWFYGFGSFAIPFSAIVCRRYLANGMCPQARRYLLRPLYARGWKFWLSSLFGIMMFGR